MDLHDGAVAGDEEQIESERNAVGVDRNRRGRGARLQDQQPLIGLERWPVAQPVFRLGTVAGDIDGKIVVAGLRDQRQAPLLEAHPLSGGCRGKVCERQGEDARCHQKMTKHCCHASSVAERLPLSAFRRPRQKREVEEGIGVASLTPDGRLNAAGPPHRPGCGRDKRQ